MKSHPPPVISPRWGARTKRSVVIGALAVLGFALWNLRHLFSFFVVAMLLSYLLWPLANFIERRMLFALPFPTRSLAVLLTIITALASIALVILLILFMTLVWPALGMPTRIG